MADEEVPDAAAAEGEEAPADTAVEEVEMSVLDALKEVRNHGTKIVSCCCCCCRIGLV